MLNRNPTYDASHMAGNPSGFDFCPPAEKRFKIEELRLSQREVIRRRYLSLKQQGLTYKEVAELCKTTLGTVMAYCKAIRPAGKELCCEHCGSSKLITGHHKQYFPEIVVWLCKSCHSKIHAHDKRNRPTKKPKQKHTLPARQLTTAIHVSNGLTHREAAIKMGISIAAVSKHMEKIYEFLRIGSVIELVNIVKSGSLNWDYQI